MNRLLILRVPIAALSFSFAAAAQPVVAPPPVVVCDPIDYPPQSPPNGGCEWVYGGNGTVVSFREVIVRDNTRLIKTNWQMIPHCGCGWYPIPQPCPPCLPTTITNTSVESVSWSVSSSQSLESGLALKFALFAELGVNMEFTEAQSQSLSGSASVTTTQQLGVQPLLCFNRHYRFVSQRRTITMNRYRDWEYAWVEYCPDPGRFTTTLCSEVVRGTATYQSPRFAQYAPQEPPCGGVVVGNPDEYDGRRETPCCPDVCEPPPTGHPCCGCEVTP